MRTATLRFVYALTVLGGLCAAPSSQAGEFSALITGPQRIDPGEFVEYTITWSGGQPPWTVDFDVFDPPFDRSMQFNIPSELNCFDVGIPDTCSVAPIPIRITTPRIARVTATVTDTAGATALADPLGVRVGTDGPIHIKGGSRFNVRPDPNSASSFLCTGGPEDPLYLSVSGDTLAPEFAILANPSLSPPNYLRVNARPADTTPETPLIPNAYSIADADWLLSPFPPAMGDVTLEFPITYGDYGLPDTGPYLDPVIPSPPIVRHTEYEVIVTTPAECSDGPLTRSLSFFLNPPQSLGPAVLSAAETTRVDDVAVEPGIPVGLRTGTRLFVEDSVDIGCVGTDFLSFLLRIVKFEAAVGATGRQEVLANLLTQPGLFEAFASECMGGGGAKGPSTIPDLQILSGRARLTFEDTAASFLVRSANASARIGNGAVMEIEQLDSGDSFFLALNQALDVIPDNAALPQRTVPPGFLVRVTADSISELQPIGIFQDGFE